MGLTKCVIPTKISRRFPDPNLNIPGGKVEHSLFFVRAKDLQHIPTDPNPRAQDTNKRIYREVADSLLSPEDKTFHLKNKGITIIAHDCRYDESSQAVEILFAEGQGIVDGAHTHRIIQEHRTECPDDQYVKLEVLTGVPPELVEPIAGGLNTSVQVSNMSLTTLSGRFQWIRDEIRGTRYEPKIAFKENEEGEYDVRDLVAILTLFNIERFHDDDHPIIAYRNKENCLALYKEAEDKFERQKKASVYRKLRPLLKDILDLHDYIQVKGRWLYNQPGTDGGPKGKAGKLSWVEKSKKGKRGKGGYTLTFSGEKTDAKLVEGALFPMLGAFRYLVEQKEGDDAYSWKLPSFAKVKELFDRVGAQMMRTTQETSKTSGRNPSVIGKNSQHWDNLYQKVALAYERSKR